MPTLFRLDASIRTEGSVTRAVADTLEQSLAADGPLEIVRRDVGRQPLDGALWHNAVEAGWVPAEQRSEDQARAVATAAVLADELAAADVVVIASPMYNYGVSQHFKTWADLLLTDPRFAKGESAVAGRPGVFVTARGGGYGPGTPREGWDHGTAWIERLLRDIWQLDLTTIDVELTLADVNPAMAELRDLAAQKLAEAHDRAAGHGDGLAQQWRSAA